MQAGDFNFANPMNFGPVDIVNNYMGQFYELYCGNEHVVARHVHVDLYDAVLDNMKAQNQRQHRTHFGLFIAPNVEIMLKGEFYT